MGLLPLQLLRDRRSSFVELYTDRQLRQDQLRHRRLPGRRLLRHRQARRRRAEGRRRPAGSRARSCRSRSCHQGKEIPAQLVDAGDADVEVHSGDWAIIRTEARSTCRALQPDTAFAYDFAEPIFRLGNDYSKGIILSTGYIGQRTANGSGHLPHRRPSGRVGGGVLQPARRPGRHPDRPDAGRLPLLVHPARCAEEMLREGRQLCDKPLHGSIRRRPGGDWSGSDWDARTEGSPLVTHSHLRARNSDLGANGCAAIEDLLTRSFGAVADLRPAIEPALDLLLEAALGRLVVPAVPRAPAAGTTCRRPRRPRRARSGSPCRSRAPSSASSARCAGAAAPARRRRSCASSAARL